MNPILDFIIIMIVLHYTLGTKEKKRRKKNSSWTRMLRQNFVPTISAKSCQKVENFEKIIKTDLCHCYLRPYSGSVAIKDKPIKEALKINSLKQQSRNSHFQRYFT